MENAAEAVLFVSVQRKKKRKRKKGLKRGRKHTLITPGMGSRDQSSAPWTEAASIARWDTSIGLSIYGI